MSRIALTGGRGFVGWHTRCAAASRGAEASLIPVGSGFDLASATTTLEGASRLVHVAGATRGPERSGGDLNRVFAEQMAEALSRASNPPPVVAFARSTQVADSAAEILGRAAAKVGAEFVDVRLPEVFGEHGNPDCDSVVATFCRAIAAGAVPPVDRDVEITLIHAQDAADVLLGYVDGSNAAQVTDTATNIRDRVQSLADVYATGDLPDLSEPFDRNLFNTFRSSVFELRTTAPYRVHRDQRGSLVELARSHGGAAQTSVSVTVAGATRAEHFHRRKAERIVPLAGTVRVGLRRMFTSEVMTIDVHAAEPTAVDIPTLWTHNFHNPGPGELLLMFWASPLHDPSDSDTYPESV